MSTSVKLPQPQVQAVVEVILISDPRHSRHKEWLAQQAADRKDEKTEDK